MKTKQEKMYDRIRRHGIHLKDIFGIQGDPVELCKRLRRLEAKAHKISLDYCNGVIDSERADYLSNDVLNKVTEILGDAENCDVRVFHNYDARGYALKIEFDPTDVRGQFIYKDMGGYGIIAPDFTE